jgi:hypothetical protein
MTGNGVLTIFHTKQIFEREIGTLVLFYKAWHSSPLFLSQTMANRFHRVPTNFHMGKFATGHRYFLSFAKTHCSILALPKHII